MPLIKVQKVLAQLSLMNKMFPKKYIYVSGFGKSRKGVLERQVKLMLAANTLRPIEWGSFPCLECASKPIS